MKKMYSTHEVAKICHVTPGSVIRWVQEGKIKASLTAGGHHRIADTDLLELLKTLRLPVPEELKEGKEIKREKKLGKQFSVLIVDDEAPVRGLLKKFFSKFFPDFRVEEAEEGFMAGWKVRGLAPDLVLVDLLLPGIDGFRVCQFIRTNPELKNTKILAITGRGEENREKVMNLGADDFLPKPFDMKLLEQKISDLLEIESEVAKNA